MPLPAYIYKLILFLSLVLFALSACDKGQKLDQYGGFFDASSGKYIYRKPGHQYFNFLSPGLEKPSVGEVQHKKFKVLFVVDNLAWLSVPIRPEFTLLTQDVKTEFKNEKDGQVAVWLVGISTRAFPFPSLSAKGRFLDLVAGKVNGIMAKKEAWVDFSLAPNGLGLIGFVYMPSSQGKEIRETLNYWMIQQGYSAYILPRDKTKHIAAFAAAERASKSAGVGYWSR